MPVDLLLLHKRLDRMVENEYGIDKENSSDSEIGRASCRERVSSPV